MGPGILICLIIAAAAQFLSGHYGAPQMLFALLLGMAVNFLMEDTKCAAGVEFCAASVLRFGVALLGLRISFDQVSSLGLYPIVWIAGGVALTILAGNLLGRITGWGGRYGMLSGGAVGICGASAALAISSVLPPDRDRERNTVFTVVVVTTMSTIAMVAYPIIATGLNLNTTEIGLFLGGTIHDVAQVVGAGYSISNEAGDNSTIVKLFRVALLMPVVLTIGLIYRARARAARNGAPGMETRPAILPFFVAGFCALVALNSADLLTPAQKQPFIDASRWCLVTAIAALGVKTSLKSLMEVGIAPLAVMLLETVFIAGWVLLGILFVL